VKNDLNPAEQLRHARQFDHTINCLRGLREKAGPRVACLAAVAMTHACVFFLGRHSNRRDTYNWMQRICDELVADAD
jgi:hypothetical protein